MSTPLNVPPERRARIRRFASSIRQIHLDFHTPDDAPGFLSRFEPSVLARQLADSGAEGVTIFGKCHYGNSYYDTKAGRRHPLLRRDMLGEFSQALRHEGLMVFGYYSTLCDLAYARAHPGQRQVGGDGAPVSDSQICPNAPYVSEVLLPQIGEMLRYDIDGLFLDLLSIVAGRRACLCAACRQKFAERHGGDLRNCPEPLLRRFRWETLHGLCLEIAAARDAAKPGALIVRNSAFLHDGDDDPFAGLEEPEDIGCGESQMMNTYVRPDLVTAALRPCGRPFMGIPVRFVYGWGEWTLKPLAQMNYENAALAAGGAVISHGDHLAADGTLDPAVLARVKQSFAFVAAREPFLKGARMVPYAAILVRRNDIYWHRALLGAVRMLADAQIPFDLLWMDQLGDLDKYGMLIVPDFAEDRRYPDQKDLLIYPLPQLTPAMQERIADWVRGGGLLLAEAGAVVREGDPSAGAALCGVSVGGPAAAIGYLVGEPPWVPAALAGFPQQMRGTMLAATATTARAVMTWQKGAGGEYAFGQQLPCPDGKSAGGSVFRNAFGSGEVLYYAFPVFATYVETNHFWLKDLVLAHLREMGGEPPARLAEPNPSVRLVVRRDDLGVLFVHMLFAVVEPATLLHAKSRVTPYPLVEHEYPLRSVDIWVKTPRPGRVTLEPGGIDVEWREECGGISCRVPEIRTWNVLRISPGEAP